jgi:hypothetical protein
MLKQKPGRFLVSDQVVHQQAYRISKQFKRKSNDKSDSKRTCQKTTFVKKQNCCNNLHQISYKLINQLLEQLQMSARIQKI